MKSLTRFVSEGFIWGVGITRPRPGKESHAGIFITGLLAGGLLAVAGMFLFVLHNIGK